jgi:hypothetical protein
MKHAHWYGKIVELVENKTEIKTEIETRIKTEIGTAK